MAESCPQCLILQQRLAELEARIEHLTRQLEQALRAGKRQAAPFRKGPPAAHPKTPGRKSGPQHGRHGHRPPPEGPVHECVQAPLPACCPHCFGDLVQTHVDTQFQLELPREPLRRRIDVHCGRCRRCGRAARGRHPCQTSDATGAAASQLGPRAQAAAVLLNKQFGLSHAKVAAVLTQLLGVGLTRGAVSQVLLRAGRRLEPAYDEILNQLPQQDWLSADETGWRIGGHPAWLHVWVGAQVTAYALDPHRDAGALEDVLGRTWTGTLVHDGWASYDRFTEAVHQQCVAHVLRRAHELEEQATGRAAVFPRQVIELFQGALAARDQFLAGARDRQSLEEAHEHYVAELLRRTERPRHNAANETLARHLYAHAEQWFVFLLDPGVPATNWPAEQATRPAVVNRKVWGGNRTVAGARAQEVLMSVVATCRQHVVNALDYVSQALCGFLTSLVPAPVIVGGR